MINPSECSITRYPDEALAGGVRHVESIDDNIRAIVERMKDIMVEQKGIGLAAPQAGVPLSIFVISTDGTKENARVYINPELTLGGELEAAEEGCLSLPGIWAKVRRHTKCTVRATDLEGNEFIEEAEGLLARALQHESDHLEGRLIIDRLGAASRIGLRSRLKELQQTYEKSRRK